MLYTYELYKPEKKTGVTVRHDVTTSIREIGPEDVTGSNYVKVSNNLTGEHFWMQSEDDLHAQRTAEERQNAWKDRQPAEQGRHEWDPFDERETDIHVVSSKEELVGKDAINPDHYKDFLFGRQWIESRQERIIRRYGPHAWMAVLETMAYKYLDRCGGKDPELQELQKALWYLRFLTAFVKNGLKPVRVEEVDKILGG